jgi:hypothetical protein
MLQVYNAVFETTLRLGGKYGPPVALTVLAFAACGIGLRVISRLAAGRGPGEG